MRENVQVRLVDEISSVLRNLGIGEMSHWGNNVVVEVVQYLGTYVPTFVICQLQVEADFLNIF